MHPLHKLIGQILVRTEMESGEPLLGKDCGGDQHVQLFCNNRAARASRFCSIDAAVRTNDELKIIIEIEESDIRPVALLGKVSASARASHCIHKRVIYPIAARAPFIQVIDTRKLSSRSSKLDQCRYLLESVRNTLSTTGGSLRGYEIFHRDIAEFERPAAQSELQDSLREAISL
jgi:hypothetical protein